MAKMTSLTENTIYRMTKGTRNFPKPIIFGKHTLRWVEEDVIDFFDKLREKTK